MPRRRLLIVAVAALALPGGCVIARATAGAPRADRDWAVDHAVAPAVTIRGDTAVIAGYRRFRHAADGAFTAAWDTVAVDLARVDRVWLGLAPFGREWMGTAHTFVTFGFRDSTYLAVSVEARRERGEAFGLLRGLTRRLELLYVIGDENDVLRQRVVGGGYDLYVYPVVSPAPRTREMLTTLLAAADSLRTRPRHYDLLTQNCTSTLADHLNAIIPGRVPGGVRTLLPGYADAVALSIGLIDAQGDRASLRRRFRVNDLVQALPDDSTFSRRLHAALTLR
jgi:hypothetical protein